MLEERCGVPVYLQNDANACALVEWKLGAGRGCSDMIFLTMGTGMGGGIIAEGKLLRGCTDMGGEIGHLRLEKDGPVGFGKAGSFEGFTSGGGIQRQARALTEKMVREGHTPAWFRDGHGPEEADAKLLAAYARAGDADAKDFFDHIGTMLGKGLALLTDTLNPEKIVIGSIFVRCEDLLLDPEGSVQVTVDISGIEAGGDPFFAGRGAGRSGPDGRDTGRSGQYYGGTVRL